MERILVGLDSSPRAALVLLASLDLARQTGAKLSVVRAATIPIEFPIEALTDTSDGLPARLVALTQDALERAVSDVPRERFERVEARIGTPWQVLCEAATELNTDLIVIGTHGHGPLDRLIGTTAARVVNHAPCSVFVVRAKAAAR
jgi:nucleotide-binding universal stress UspA family protein